MYTDEQLEEIVRKQKLVESYLARGKTNRFRWVAGKTTIVNQIHTLSRAALYNIKLDKEIMNVKHRLGDGYGVVEPGRIYEEMMDDNDDILTYSVHHFQIKGEGVD